ncbi:MAG: DUF166 domain-containing protein [Nitrospirota bacterium]|nr:DUF166 domain-containing protein [Nitrospirota bacterium]
MKLLIIAPQEPVKTPKKDFTVRFDNLFSERVIRHLTNEYKDLCNGCGNDCNFCRDRFPLLYPVDFKEKIVDIIRLPSEMLYYLDDPREFFPGRKLPVHDVLLAINVHEELMMALPEMIAEVGGKALVAPGEDPRWLGKWMRGEVKKRCKKLKIEVSFPKPFCAMKEGEGPVLDEFMREFRIGRPGIKIDVVDGVITDAIVTSSAPCGCTYYVAHNIIGTNIDENSIEKINTEITAKYWHSYPCVASMDMDADVGDTLLHIGGFMHYEGVEKAIKAVKEPEEPELGK